MEFTRKDGDACMVFDISAFTDHADSETIRVLSDTFRDTYQSELED